MSAPPPPPPGQHAQTWHGWRPPPPPPPTPAPPPPSQPVQASSVPASANPPNVPSTAPPHPPQIQPTQTPAAAAPPAPHPPPEKPKDYDPLDILDEIDFDEPEIPPEVVPGPTKKPRVSEAPPASSDPKSSSKGKSKSSQEKKKGIARQTQHSKELIHAFRPIQIFLFIIGQMPFVIKPKKDGTYSFKFYKISRQAFTYFTILFITFSVSLLVTGGILSFVLDSIFYFNPKYTVIVKDKTTGLTETWKWERYIIRHEMVAMIVVWSWLAVACVGSLYIVTNSKYYIHYMNYFNRVVQIMDMDMTPGVSAYLFVNNIASLAVAVALIVGFAAGYIWDFTAVTNTSSVIANFIFRLFSIEIETFEDDKFWFQLAGFVIMIYALFASRANVIQFLFFSQLLKNGSKIWNERLRKVLTHDITNDEDDQFSRRLEARLIYKDHLMIVQLYQMTENVFGSILFAYYSLTIISVVMELYQLASLQGFGTDAGSDNGDQDSTEELKEQLLQDRLGQSTAQDVTQEHEVLAVVLVSVLLLLQNVYFCYRTTVDAAKAYEYAMKGFDILRRHGLMYCKNKTDRNFVLSLYFSFAKNNPLQLTAGGYFAVNKVLLVTMSATIINWAISIYQTRVDQWK